MLNVQQALMKQSFDARPEGGLIEETQSLARLNFSVFECKFLGTADNRAADLGYRCIRPCLVLKNFRKSIL